MEGLKTLKAWNSYFSPKMMTMLYSWVIKTSSVKHHLTHKHNFEIYNIVLSSEIISLKQDLI